MTPYDPSKSTWYNENIEYLFNGEIIEYDIVSAGISLIREYQLLPTDIITRLEGLGKTERNVAIGKLQRDDRRFSGDLLGAFCRIRELFVRDNNLSDDRLIAVKKDALFTIGECRATTFGSVVFQPKNRYSSYLRFSGNMNIELLYRDAETEVKGISTLSLAKHRLYMLEFLSNYMGLMELSDPTVRGYLRKFVDRYRAMELDDAYYLEFNSSSSKLDPLFNYQKVLVPLVQLTLREMTT